MEFAVIVTVGVGIEDGETVTTLVGFPGRILTNTPLLPRKIPTNAAITVAAAPIREANTVESIRRWRLPAARFVVMQAC